MRENPVPGCQTKQTDEQMTRLHENDDIYKKRKKQLEFGE